MGNTHQAPADRPVHELISQRWSPYGFSDRVVEPDDVAALLEAARWSASSYNAQPWRFVVAPQADRAAFENLLACLVPPNRAWATHASVLAMGLYAERFDNGEENRCGAHDLGAAAAQLTFEATARGIAVHQMAGILPGEVRSRCGVPDGVVPFTALAIGYPGTPADLDPDVAGRDGRARERMPVADFTFAGGWDTPYSPG